jgi:hypothetical protein
MEDLLQKPRGFFYADDERPVDGFAASEETARDSAESRQGDDTDPVAFGILGGWALFANVLADSTGMLSAYLLAIGQERDDNGEHRAKLVSRIPFPLSPILHGSCRIETHGFRLSFASADVLISAKVNVNLRREHTLTGYLVRRRGLDGIHISMCYGAKNLNLLFDGPGRSPEAMQRMSVLDKFVSTDAEWQKTQFLFQGGADLSELRAVVGQFTGAKTVAGAKQRLSALGLSLPASLALGFKVEEIDIATLQQLSITLLTS